MPPSAQLNNSGTSGKLGRDRLDLLLIRGASTKRTSAPASRYRRARSSAASSPSTARASVRAMMTKLRGLSRRGRGAELRRPSRRSVTTCLPSMCPHFLGDDLVLEMDRGDTGLLVLLHRADHVDRVAVAGVGVGDERQLDGLSDAVRVVDHLASSSARPTSGRPSDRRCGAEAGHVHRVESGFLDESSAERVVHARSEYRSTGREQLPQAPRSIRRRAQIVRHQFSRRVAVDVWRAVSRRGSRRARTSRPGRSSG